MSYNTRFSQFAETPQSSRVGLSIQENPHTLSAIQAVACAAILEEAIDQLEVLGNLGDLPDVEADLTYCSPEHRFGRRKIEAPIFDLKTIEPYELALYKEKFVKFQTDRSYVAKIIKETIKNLLKDSSYQCLINYINQYNTQLNDEAQVLMEEAKNKTRINHLKNLVEKDRRESLHALQHFSEKIGKLKDQVEDLTFENKVKTNYIDNWENSRMEQNNLSLDKREEYYINIINQTKTNIEREIRIDAEIEAFIRETQKDYQDAIQVWMERYDKGIETRDTEIQILKEKREDQFAQLRRLAKLYEVHRQQITEYLEYKEKRKQEEELLSKMHNAATKIQAWWKGTMVRKGLGPYRKGKGKKGDDKGKKKGKK